VSAPVPHECTRTFRDTPQSTARSECPSAPPKRGGGTGGHSSSPPASSPDSLSAPQEATLNRELMAGKTLKQGSNLRAARREEVRQ
jgi:hypothetical protein